LELLRNYIDIEVIPLDPEFLKNPSFINLNNPVDYCEKCLNTNVNGHLPNFSSLSIFAHHLITQEDRIFEFAKLKAFFSVETSMRHPSISYSSLLKPNFTITVCLKPGYQQFQKFPDSGLPSAYKESYISLAKGLLLFLTI